MHMPILIWQKKHLSWKPKIDISKGVSLLLKKILIIGKMLLFGIKKRLKLPQSSGLNI